MGEADRGTNPRLRKSLSVALSAGLHSWILAWVILGEPAPPAPPPKSIYDQEIRPNEKKIVWYNLQEKLPAIAPATARPEARPLRAKVKAPQAMVAGERDLTKLSPLVFSPKPEAPVPEKMPLPNVVAIAPPPPVVKPFVPPPDAPAPRIAPPNLPEPPRVASSRVKTSLPITATGPKPEPRAFTPPPVTRMQRQAAILLPEAPVVAQVVEPNALPFTATGPKPRPRDFVAPAEAKRGPGPAPALPAAPDVASNNPAATGGALDRLPRAFLPPPNRPGSAPAPPPVNGNAPVLPGSTAQATLAIVGLTPSKATELPAPPASRPGGFSAGPEVRPDGASSNLNMPLLNVPGLTVNDNKREAKPGIMAPFSPTSRENLMAAARTVTPGVPKSLAPPETHASRVSSAPDVRFTGREVYSIAIQMPNITSFSGSWLVWFAERDMIPLGPGAPTPTMRPPSPLRKVDPKYIASAVADRIEGRVRLFGVIRKDGKVDAISVIQHLDDRLDGSASEALAKWEFSPALRNGVPVDVEAVFEIPFHLAPRPTK